MKERALKKFLRYIEINTQSNVAAGSFPSTITQFDLANLLVDELKTLGLRDACVDKHCHVMATLPANLDKDLPKIGLIAHLDTSPEVSGKNIKPRTIETYEGVDFFDMEKFGADFAYTVDGGVAGELNRETFSANEASVEIEGRNIHPGTAKNGMVNAIRVMGNIISRLPSDMAPETTEGYDPFIHPMTMEGSVARASMKMILRDFKTEGLDTQKEILEKIISDVQVLFPKAKIKLKINKGFPCYMLSLTSHP